MSTYTESIRTAEGAGADAPVTDEVAAITTPVNGAAAANADGAVVTPTEGTDPVDATPDAPQIRIVKGAPTDADVAAIVAVLAAAAATSVPVIEAARPPETWGEPTRLHRGAVPFSPYSFPNASTHRF